MHRSERKGFPAADLFTGSRPTPKEGASRRSSLRRFFAQLGPGLITGSANDDPSAITTYSIAGAQLGTSLLWTAWWTWPFLAVVQMMCARIGMVTGAGVVASLRARFPKPLL